MPKTGPGTAVPKEAVLDAATMRKVKQHNKIILQHKKQDAVALRQKLEQWKAEKKQKKSQEQKPVPFVTTVLKLKGTQEKSLQQTSHPKPSMSETLVLPNKATAQGAKRDQAEKVVEKGNKGRFVRPLPPVKRPVPTQKENKVSIAAKPPPPGHKHAAKTKKPAPASSLSRKSSETRTPLSRKAGLGKRYVIANLTERAGEGGKPVRPVTLAEELQAASGGQPISSETMSARPSSEEARGRSGKTPVSDAAVTRTGSSQRNSLSARFRQSKNPDHAEKRSSVSRASQSVAATKTAKSILRSSEPSVKFSSTVGASPNLSSAASGHVTFVTEKGKTGHDGATFRKTPGKAKTQEYMRSKLNEWLAVRGHTPTSLRHACCFGGEGHDSRRQTPRSQVKACMSVEQLSKQENALTREETQKRSLRLAPTPRTSKMLSSTFTSEAPSQSSSAGSLTTSSPTVAHSDHAEDATAVGMAGSEDYDSGVERAGLSRHADSMEQLDRDYGKCLAALDSGLLSTGEALQWLERVSEVCSEACRQVGWYRCQVAALKKANDQDTLLAVFEQAIINNAQPVAEMAQLLTDTMREMLHDHSRTRHTRSSTTTTATKRAADSALYQVSLPDVQTKNVFESTTVKYSVVEVTPFKKRRRVTEAGGHLVPVITPVRRSARLTRSAAPPSQGRTPMVAWYTAEYSALEEVPSAEKERMLFQPNLALEPLLQAASPEAE